MYEEPKPLFKQHLRTEEHGMDPPGRYVKTYGRKGGGQ